MEKQRRIILYGKSVIVGSVGAGLQDVPGLEIIPVALPLRDAEDLGALAPDVIIFDLDAAHPDAALSMLRQQPELLLIGVDPASDKLVVVTARERRAAAVADLLEVIDRDTETLAKQQSG